MFRVDVCVRRKKRTDEIDEIEGGESEGEGRGGCESGKGAKGIVSFRRVRRGKLQISWVERGEDGASLNKMPNLHRHRWHEFNLQL